MAMKVHNVVVGSLEWKAIRTDYKVASEAAAMMGADPNFSRSDLLRLKATGIEREISEWVEKFVFKRGHETEARARPIAEEMIGDKLYALMGTNTVEGLALLATFDGITMPMYDLHWEHKQYNQELFEIVDTGGELPPKIYWQLEHQLAVNENDYGIFAVSDGTKKNYRQFEYHSRPERRAQLLAGWKLFDQDLKNYVAEELKVEVTGEAIKDLPALLVEIYGEVRSSNLAVYQNNALDFIRNINTDLQTDQDFANAKKVVTFLEDKAKQLALKEEEIIGQAYSINEVVRTLRQIKDEMDKTRLHLDKLIKAEEQNRKTEALAAVQADWTAFCAALTLPAGLKLPAIAPDFAKAVRSRRTLATYKEAAKNELVRAKTEAMVLRDHIEENLAMLNALAPEHMFLFADLQQLVLKDSEALEAIAKQRLSEHKTNEARKRLAEEAEAKAKADAEAERQRLQEAAKAAPAPTPAPTPAPNPVVTPIAAAKPIQGDLIGSAPAPAASIKGGGVSFNNWGPGTRPDYSKVAPSDRAIIQAVAAAFNTTNTKAVEWVSGINLPEVRKWANTKQAM